ncbi:phosphotransferase [Actinokineospora sp.]|uniref:phosphotransferase n=1 Tax=Actinokineospora sp. TaxID=1872133 RepID=UPI004037A625
MSTFPDFLAAEFPGAEITELSGSNNVVYQVRSGSEVVVAKHVTDTDIPLTYLADATAKLAEQLPVQRILRVCERDRGEPFDAVFAEYVEGRNLATVLAEDERAVPTADLVAHLCRFVTACREMPKMHDGFGLYKRDAPVIGTHREFVEHYGRRYWNRARPFYDGTRVGTAVDEWLSGGFAAAAERNPAAFTVVAIDANLKNFIVTPDGRIVVLNVPIAGFSTPAHAVGAISAHLRNREPHKHFLDAVEGGICADDADLVPHFELWALLGILSFYAVREPNRQREWRNWGSPVSLDEDFRNLVETHISRAGAR